MPTTLERLSEAVNSHDAERMATLFAEDYASSQPVHPGARLRWSCTGRQELDGTLRGST